MVQFKFGLLEHGWLPVFFKTEDFTLELDASDVPVNPLDELCNALIAVMQGGTAEAGWHLEPVWYWFRFETFKETVSLSISENIWGHEKLEKFRITDTLETIVWPFYKALKGISSLDYG
jgi:hypothetical protein